MRIPCFFQSGGRKLQPKMINFILLLFRKSINNITFPIFEGAVPDQWPGGVNNKLQIITFSFSQDFVGTWVLSCCHGWAGDKLYAPTYCGLRYLTSDQCDIWAHFQSEPRRANLKSSSEFYLFTPGQPESQDFAELFKISFELRFKQTSWQMPHIYHPRGQMGSL